MKVLAPIEDAAVTTTGILRATGPVSEAYSGIPRLDIGVNNGSPRIIFEEPRGGVGNAKRIWQIDNDFGVFRWYTPNGVELSLTDDVGLECQGRVTGLAGLYDGVNRAYSASNPPPATGGIAGVLANNTVATTETVVATHTVPANFLTSGSVCQLTGGGQVSSTATLTWRIRMGTLGTIADPLVAVTAVSAALVANAMCYYDFTMQMLTATTAHALGEVRMGGNSNGVASNAFAAATVNLTVANKVTVTLVQSAAQTYTSRIAALAKLV